MSLLDTLRLLSQMRRKSFWRLKRLLGFWPHDIRLYQLALRHKSISSTDLFPELKKIDGKTRIHNNERLEFLGDAILGAIVADILFETYPDKREGFLTSMRSKIVCRNSLNELSEKIGLNKFVMYSEDFSRSHNSYINGNAFEAFIGAIYVDRGYKQCYKFIQKEIFGRYIDTQHLDSNVTNYKSKLIEWCQKNQYQISFNYFQKKMGNSPLFTCKVIIEGIECGKGIGYKKIESDQDACKNIIMNIQESNELVNMLEQAFEDKRQLALEQARRKRDISKLVGRKTIIFDLDGTLMNTLKDLYLSTNYALRECGYEERSIEEVRNMVGNGIGMLIHRALPDRITRWETPENKEAEKHCLEIFEQHYLEHCQDNTRLYPGIRDLLEILKDEGYKIAIVSNKLQEGVSELHEKWFKDTVDVAIGESEGINKKPAPDMVDLAIERLGATLDDSIYIGDSEVDLETAYNAQLPCISVLWGFRSKEFLVDNGATLMVEKPDEIISLLRQSNK